MSAVKYSETLWEDALRCRRVYDESRLNMHLLQHCTNLFNFLCEHARAQAKTIHYRVWRVLRGGFQSYKNDQKPQAAMALIH